MQSTLGCLSRLISRSFVSGVVSTKDAKEQTRLVTAVSGFPKEKVGGYSIENILKGQIGDDAYFVARHVDDWSSDVGDGAITTPAGTSACDDTSESAHNATTLGVADGVGGWRQYGVDPGQFSRQLMYNCERLVRAGHFAANQPARLLAQGYREMQESKQQIIGSSTACVMMLSHADRILRTANIGDSGFLVVRNGEVVHRSREQQHSFNTPFQLSLPPSEMASDVLSDRPESADCYEFPVEDGDVILLATDGIFDNVPISLLVDQISSNMMATSTVSATDPESVVVTFDGSTRRVPSSLSEFETEEDFARSCEEVAVRLQQCANSIALIARKLSQDPNFLSPFAKNARAAGMSDVRGGKDDDITVLLAAVKVRRSMDGTGQEESHDNISKSASDDGSRAQA